MAISGELQWTIKTDEDETLSQSADPVTLPANATTSVRHTFTPPAPGFYEVNCILQSADQNVELTWTKFIGFEPEAIESPLTREPDFDAFWDDTLAELSAVEPEFEMQRSPSRDSDTHDVYEVTMRSLGRPAEISSTAARRSRAPIAEHVITGRCRPSEVPMDGIFQSVPKTG